MKFNVDKGRDSLLEKSQEYLSDSLLSFLVNERYIPRDFSHDRRTAYGGLLLKFFRERGGQSLLACMKYNELNISIEFQVKHPLYSVKSCTIGKTEKKRTSLPLMYTKVYDAMFFSALGSIVADLPTKEFIKSEFNQYGDDNYEVFEEKGEPSASLEVELATA